MNRNIQVAPRLLIYIWWRSSKNSNTRHKQLTELNRKKNFSAPWYKEMVSRNKNRKMTKNIYKQTGDNNLVSLNILGMQIVLKIFVQKKRKFWWKSIPIVVDDEKLQIISKKK